jgi:hypothetical protein
MHGGAAGRYITLPPSLILYIYIYMYTLVASLITYYIYIYINKGGIFVITHRRDEQPGNLHLLLHHRCKKKENTALVFEVFSMVVLSLSW